jgi:AraC-like DNA-binding protein
MARLLDRIPFGYWSAVRAPRDLPLHAMARSVGRATERGAGYDWDGMSRGRSEFAVLQVTLDGCGLVEHEGGADRVPVGTAMLVVVPGDHRYRIDPGTGFWEFCYAVLYGRELLRVLRHATRAGPLLPWDPSGDAETALFRLFSSFTSPERASPYDLSGRAYAVGMALLAPGARHGGAGRDRRIVLAVEYVHENLGRPLPVDELAAVAGMSRYHFSRVFAAVTGLSPTRYVREARCERAALLLATTRLPVKAIAAESGFENTAYFCRVFRQITSLTPSEYRHSRPQP